MSLAQQHSNPLGCTTASKSPPKRCWKSGTHPLEEESQDERSVGWHSEWRDPDPGSLATDTSRSDQDVECFGGCLGAETYREGEKVELPTSPTPTPTRVLNSVAACTTGVTNSTSVSAAAPATWPIIGTRTLTVSRPDAAT